ncbi:conserved hypothetical protein [Talaromyces stipitatus ATCC 10500]|uniref:Restriction endonuclease type IV Mrr domain-containing protein n=1 Tax=Talaromyces stipitatus (strain ATCC 10500 / CBS 375.48 / QM 6759 / NRRL 1006) TaxID=441959 RepID=B8MRN1_TALSN|nr:uncharacterized protein TSTA_056850 [Talaromyces stipitatus ATCC 10500]EED13188.1 conserved hypothetical protein [Talaromyces stipitatus ATCC 10500]
MELTNRNIISPFTRHLLKIPKAPPAPSQNHHDLPSFLTYAKQTALPETTTTYVGTKYEYTVQSTLRRFAFDLERIGGRDDAGIDLVGTWHIPGREFTPFRVIVQCKALKKKLGPNLVRELEGAFRHSPVGWRTSEKVAVLVSPREATKGVRDTLTRSSYPLFWMMMESDGALKQVLWNSKVEELGLAPLGVETRYSPLADATSDDRPRPDVVLAWDGSDIPDMGAVEDTISLKEAEWLSAWGCEDLPEAQKYELLTLLENSYPELTREIINGGVTEDFGPKKQQVLLLLKEKFKERFN